MEEETTSRRIRLDEGFHSWYKGDMMKLLSTEEAAAAKGVSVRRIQQLIESGALEAQKVGRDYVMEESAVRKLRVYGKPGRPPKLGPVIPKSNATLIKTDAAPSRAITHAVSSEPPMHPSDRLTREVQRNRPGVRSERKTPAPAAASIPGDIAIAFGAAEAPPTCRHPSGRRNAAGKCLECGAKVGAAAGKGI